MNAIHKHLAHAAMIGGGLVAMALTAKPLTGCDALDFPINPLGVNRSPYGEVFAMAMQGPIDTHFNQTHIGVPSYHDPLTKNRPANFAGLPWNERMRFFLEDLEKASTARTNRHRQSKAMDAHIRRQVQKKLRFAYRLDPAHYGNYNSYHFFLTEPQVGIQRYLTPEAARLSRETIDYCLAESHDPRPALTAAAAATNVIHLMFADRNNEEPIFTARQMRECLDLIDHCIARHLAIHEQWSAAGHNELLSPMRILEMEERFNFVRRIRDAAVPAVARFENEENSANVLPENNVIK